MKDIYELRAGYYDADNTLMRMHIGSIKDKVINEPMLCDKKYQMFKKNTNRKTKEILRNTDILVMNNSLSGNNNLLKNSL